MKKQFTTTIQIDSSPDFVFDYFADTHNLHIWVPALHHVGYLGQLKPDLTYPTTYLIAGQKFTTRAAVIRLQRPGLLEMSATSKALEYHLVWTLQPGRAGTNLSVTVTITSNHATFGLAAAIIQMVAEDQMRGSLTALKRAVESQPQPA